LAESNRIRFTQSTQPLYILLTLSQGGQLVGAAMKGRRVLVIDDVITAGKAQ
jgi:adenine/guanine phosphoribosyltransferase-like PRPP-binding protein